MPQPVSNPPADTIVISTTGALQAFLATVCSASMLYVDLEGYNLSRHGTLSFITIRAFPHADIHVIDVQVLGRDAFAARSVFGLTLGSILENPGVRKCFWDVRNDSDALWAHYRIRLQGVVDLQLLENASRPRDKTYVSGLETAIRLDLRLPPDELDHDSRVRRVIAARAPFTVFSMRPLDSDVVEYCVNNIRCLPRLHAFYLERITGDWLSKATAETVRRVNVAYAPRYDPVSPSKALGPWGSGQNQRIGISHR